MDGLLIICGERFDVEQEYWRTRGSRDQRLIPAGRRRRCGRSLSPLSRFFVVRRGGEQYWVKEYLVPPPGGVAYEANEMRRLAGMQSDGVGLVGPAQLVLNDETRLVMEYLRGFALLSQAGDSTKHILDRVDWWLSRMPIDSYDLSVNNVLYDKAHDVVKLVDFAFSPDCDRKRWDQILSRDGVR